MIHLRLPVRLMQWLTFWLILTILLFIERFLARVVLSTFPLYYQAKLCLIGGSSSASHTDPPLICGSPTSHWWVLQRLSHGLPLSLARTPA